MWLLAESRLQLFKTWTGQLRGSQNCIRQTLFLSFFRTSSKTHTKYHQTLNIDEHHTIYRATIISCRCIPTSPPPRWMCALCRFRILHRTPAYHDLSYHSHGNCMKCSKWLRETKSMTLFRGWIMAKHSRYVPIIVCFVEWSGALYRQ